MSAVVPSKIRKWFGAKGFGFARPVDAGPQERDRDVFVHARALDPALQHLARLDYPVADAPGGAVPGAGWPVVFVESEPSEKGLRARRVSAEAFPSGERCAALFAPAARPGGGPPVGSAVNAAPGTGFRPPSKAPREGERRPRGFDKGGGGRRGQRGHDD